MNLEKFKSVENTSCFDEHKKRKLCCLNEKCKYWHAMQEHHNCTIIAAQTGEKTLQMIGDTFGVTRMRICQIEKMVLQKLSSNKGLKEYSSESDS
jgi:DNA-directed RNA polymerase specialized sigma subunit